MHLLAQSRRLHLPTSLLLSFCPAVQFTSIERLNYYTHQIPHEQVTSSDGAGAPRQVTVVTAATSAAAAASNTTAVVRSIANNPCGFPAWYPAAWDSHLKQAAWPSRGEVAFNNVSVRYREGLPLVLQGVTFRIQPSFKVAVVGRTGSGKTTMTQALFRMMECASGSITIDGVDIASVNVYQLRSSLDIIPQDPVIYAGACTAQPTTAVALVSRRQRASCAT